MANGTSPYIYTDRFTSQTGANFLSALASIERMYRADRADDKSFRHDFLLQDRRLTAEAHEREAQRNLDFQQSLLTELNEEVRDYRDRAQILQSDIKESNWTEGSLRKLAAHKTTADGASILSSLNNLLKQKHGILSKENISMGDLIEAARIRGDIASTKYNNLRRLTEISQEIDYELNTNAPQWYRDYKSGVELKGGKTSTSTDLNDALAQYRNNTVDSQEMQALIIDLDKEGTQWEGLSTNKILQGKVVAQVLASQDKEFLRLKGFSDFNEAYKAGIRADRDDRNGMFDEAMLGYSQMAANAVSGAFSSLGTAKYEKVETMSRAMDDFVSDLVKDINSVFKSAGVPKTPLAEHLILGSQEIAQMIARDPSEKIDAFGPLIQRINSALMERDPENNIDSKVVTRLFNRMRHSGILNIFDEDALKTVEDAFNTVENAKEQIIKLNAEKLKNLETSLLPGIKTGDLELDTDTDTDEETLVENKIVAPSGVLNLTTMSIEDEDGAFIRDATPVDVGDFVSNHGTDKQKVQWADAISDFHKLRENEDLNTALDEMYTSTSAYERSFGFDLPHLSLSNPTTYATNLSNSLDNTYNEKNILDDDNDEVPADLSNVLGDWEFKGYSEGLGWSTPRAGAPEFENTVTGASSFSPFVDEPWFKDITGDEWKLWSNYLGELQSKFEAGAELRELNKQVTELKDKKGRVRKAYKSGNYLARRESELDAEIKLLNAQIADMDKGAPPLVSR